MTTTEIYERIGEIAADAKGPMKLKQLNEKLGNIDDVPRATGNRVRGAYNYFIAKGGRSREIAERIARTYVGEDGKYLFKQ